MNAREENGDEYEPSTISSFQRSIQDSDAHMRRDICLKNPKGYFLRNVNHWFNSMAKETSCKVLRRLTKVRKMLVFKLDNYATPV